ncbi:hypothetical protein V5738_07095 [Salinisphaera sp. SPP-AMP-43]|uniref:hypothetical protein n=1 Tax=Salinisphaera sp. SPP-AMP-43 TaxID=3121288 RepID=UPI003C6E5CAA
MTHPHSLLTGVLCVSALAASSAAVAQDHSDASTYSTINNLGDLSSNTSGNPAPLHLNAGFEANSADYFRGGYDGVSTDASDTALSPFASISLDLPTLGLFDALNLTAGSHTSFTTNTVAAQRNGHRESWYEANNFVGLSGQMAHDFSLGVTYTDYTSPNDQFASSQELAVALGHQDVLHPQLKVATPVDNGEGTFVRGDISPAVQTFESTDHPVTFKLPLAIGAGFDDYYGDDTGTPGFVSAGAHASLALSQPDGQFGHWTVDAGVDVMARNDDLQDVNPEHDDTVIPVGMVRIAVAY